LPAPRPTGRLRAESPDPARHLEFIVDLYSDPEITRWHWPGPEGGPRTPEQSRELLGLSIDRMALNGYGMWFWREIESGELVARVGLNPAVIEGGTEVVEVGWSVPLAHQGKGYATEAARASVAFGLEEAGLDDVVSFAMVENAASRRVIEKAGLEYRRDFIHAGLPHALYGIPQPTSTKTMKAT
jgi:RimJ/RimL family protein N-acetyltransferase